MYSYCDNKDNNNEKDKEKNEASLLEFESYFFVGIGGSGMAPLAEYQKLSEKNIYGFDIKSSSTTDYLSSIGIKIFFDIPEAEKYIQSINSKTLMVISSAIKDQDPLLCAARSNSYISLTHRSDLISSICNKKKLLGISGTHGKTTTSAMLAYTLDKLDLDPSYIIGGKILGSKQLCKKGNSDYIVAEIDESDGSILKYNPFIPVITNIEEDHLDYYKTLQNEISTFMSYLSHSTQGGSWVLFDEIQLDPSISIDNFSPIIRFGFKKDSNIQIVSTHQKHSQIEFNLNINGSLYNSSINMFGKHNVANVCAVVGVCMCLGLEPKDVLLALKSYPGVKRRMNLIYQTTVNNFDVIIYDDYAHNPGKMKACLLALHEAYPDYQINVLYEPHRYSRLETMFEQTISSFKNTSNVYVFPVYTAGENSNNKDLYSSSYISEKINQYSKVNTIPLMQNETILDKISYEDIKTNTIYISLGAGSVNVQARLLKHYFSQV